MGMQPHFIDPGKPVQNAHIESFNGRHIYANAVVAC